MAVRGMHSYGQHPQTLYKLYYSTYTITPVQNDAMMMTTVHCLVTSRDFFIYRKIAEMKVEPGIKAALCIYLCVTIKSIYALSPRLGIYTFFKDLSS